MKHLAVLLRTTVPLLEVRAATQAQTPLVVSRSLASMSWVDAQKLLTRDAVVVFAAGNASKADGPHLPLAADFRDVLARRTAE